MDRLFRQYEENYNSLSASMGDKMPRALRLLDVKLRLALGIQIDFDSAVSHTKTPAVKDSYVCLIKLAELWNAFEALVDYAGRKYNFKDKFDIVNKVEPQYTTEPLLKGFDGLAELYSKEPFANDFGRFTERANAQLKKPHRERLEAITGCLKGRTKAAPVFLLHLICMERNLFYHTGEAVKMGMDYRSRKKLLTLYYNAFKKYLLTTAAIILR